MTFLPDIKRPGLSIKDFLLQHGEASVTDMHHHYKRRLQNANQMRRGGLRPFRIASYHSFYSYFKRIAAMGWVKLVRYDDAVRRTLVDGDKVKKMGWKAQDDLAKSAFPRKIQPGVPVKVVRGVKVGIWRLTPQGLAEQDGWGNPWRAGEVEMPIAPPALPSAVPPVPELEEPEQPPQPRGPDMEAILDQLKGILDEDRKAKSIGKLSDLLSRYSLSEDELVGFDDVESAINEYRDIEKEGMTPEEYRDEKADAWENLVDAVEALELAEEE